MPIRSERLAAQPGVPAHPRLGQQHVEGDEAVDDHASPEDPGEWDGLETP